MNVATSNHLQKNTPKDPQEQYVEGILSATRDKMKTGFVRLNRFFFLPSPINNRLIHEETGSFTLSLSLCLSLMRCFNSLDRIFSSQSETEEGGSS